MFNNIKKIAFSFSLFLGFLVIFLIGFFAGHFATYTIPQPGTIDFSLFWDAYNKLNEKFIDNSKIDNKKIIYGAISGMADSLGDPYTSFFNPDEAKKFNQDLSGSFDGIGAEIGIKKGLLTVIAPLKNTPAEKAGLEPGDIIIKIDGKDAANMSTEEAVTLIRGLKNTEVVLTIFREEWVKAQEISIIRDTIKVPTIEWTLKDGDIAYIQVYQFGLNLVSDFQNIALQILKSPAKKIVLDLRGNPGGYLNVAQNIAGWFLPLNQIVVIEDFGGNSEQQIYKSEGNSQLLDYPIVVLINEGSASASEILAGALRDNRNAKLIGEKSFGKGSVQEVVYLPNGSFLKITVAKWLTPKGALISDVGLTPDIKIAITDDDIIANKDPQLSKALEIVKSLK
jgi:carboxyl-terminal processing protease